MITFTVHGKAIAQRRPRAFRRGNYIGFYDPKSCRKWKEAVQWQAPRHRPSTKLIEGPVGLEIAFYLPRPKRLPKKVQYHTKKPDLDNLVKAVKDALQGVIYKNDSQVCRLTAYKTYADKPRVEVTIVEQNIAGENLISKAA